jgi:adenylate cyclase
MSDAQDLAAMLAVRNQPDADRAAIDSLIFQRFGCNKAVMFTDLVGFSRRVEEFGILHFLQLIQESEALFLPLIKLHGGRCLKRDGDSLMVLFDLPTDALGAALAMIDATIAVNPLRPPEQRIDICIGLGYGEVLLIDDNEVWGAEVNAASKLGEEVAEGGELLATEGFRFAVPDAQFAEHGVLFGTRPAFRWVGDALVMPESKY